MKQLALQSEAYRYLVHGFRQWLETVGYNEQAVYQLPNYVQELLYHAESRGYTALSQLDNTLIREHYDRLKKRPNQRRGGGLSNNYLNKHLDAYKRFGEYLRQSGRLLLPPLDIDTESNEDRITAILTVREIGLLYDTTQLRYELGKYDRGPAYHEAMQLRDRAMLTIFYGCGLRRSEGYHLDRDDLDGSKALLHVRKGKNYRERFVPLTGPSLACLQAYLYEGRPYFLAARNEAFFVGPGGRRLSGAAMLLRLQKLIQLTEDEALIRKEIHLHSLRHSIATHLLANGMSLERIAEFLGHSSLESTQLYTHYVQTLQSSNHDPELSEVPRVADPEGL
ncbi:MAG TPA: tyrosine-type recombinase/integrase [Puia sp.]|jgi:integrase/recombinase XerD|nr:tyrosine-type recombinase/integrase [Puia sp.]